MKLIHLTDTHFVPRGETLYGGDPRETLVRCVDDINRQHGDADLCVVTGDLTHWGEPDAFESLRECLVPLRPPLQLLIGNHDNREEFRRWFPEQVLDEIGFVQSVRDFAPGRFLFLDTVQEGTHAGWYCEARQAWLAKRLEEAGDRPIYLFMHHPPFAIGLEPLDRISLQQKEAFAAIVRPHRGKIKHLFFGHIHRPLSGHWMGISFSTLRAINHQCWLDFTNTGAIAGSFEPPAYSIVLFENDRLIVHTHDFLDDSAKFSLTRSPVKDWALRHAHP